MILSNARESARVENVPFVVENVPFVVEVMSNDVSGQGFRGECCFKEIDETPLRDLSRKNKVKNGDVVASSPEGSSLLFEKNIFVSESDTFVYAKDVVKDLISGEDILYHIDHIIPNPLLSNVNMCEDISELNAYANELIVENVDVNFVINKTVLDLGWQI